MARAVAGNTRAALAGLAAVNGQGAILWEGDREGLFTFDASDLSTMVAADTAQGIFIAPASDASGASGAWVRKFDGELDAKWFGAVGDGVADDTVALQRLLDYASAVGGAAVRLPEGTYLVSSYLTIGTRTLVRGAGKFTSKITSAHAGGGGANAGQDMRNGSCFVSSSAINASTGVWIGIEDICLENTNAANVGAAYYDTGGTFIHVHNMRAIGFKYGVVFDQTELSDIDLCQFDSQTAGGAAVWLVNGEDLTPGVLPAFTNRISVKRCQINQPGTNYGILDDGGATHAFEDNNYNGCLNHIRMSGEAYVSVRGGEFESAAGDCISSNLATLSGLINGSNVLFVEGAQFAMTTGNAAIDCSAGAGSVGVSGGTTFGGGGGTNPITGVANLFRLWLGHTHNVTAVAVADGQATNHNDTTGSIVGTAAATAPGTGFVTSPSLFGRSSGSVDGDVTTVIIDHGGNGGQVYLQSLLTLATGYSKYIVRTRAGDGMAERMRLDENGLNLPTGSAFKINAVQVVGARGAAVADATDAASVITQLNALLARLRAHGLIAP